jgi:two-component system chemotaxis response regulator CheY
MSKPVILCIDDQREVLAALLKDLDRFAEHFDLIDAESAEDAGAVLDDLVDRGTPVALIISDHVMPGVTGVEFLTGVRQRGDLPHTGKLLLTGLATHEDTIRAINEAAVDRYIAKPWQTDKLHDVVGRLITGFILAVYPDDYQRFMPILNQDVMVERMQQGFGPHGDR